MKKRKMKPLTKIILAVVLVAIVCVGAYIAYYVMHYTTYDKYKQYLGDYTKYEEGTEFAGKADSSFTEEGFVLASENDSFKLYINTANCYVVLLDKKTGEMFSSNPLEVKTAGDASTNDYYFQYLQSQLKVSYRTDASIELSQDYFTYTDCVGLEKAEGEAPQYTIEQLEKGVRVTYTLGDSATSTGIVPIYLTEERYQELVSRQEEAGVKSGNRMKNLYQPSSTVDGFLELAEASRSTFKIRKLTAGLEEIGYTYNDYLADAEVAANAGAPVEKIQNIIVPVEYRLAEDGLQVTIPTEHVSATEGVYITEISVLPYFAAVKEGTSQNGYFLVPNGSGSLINFDSKLMKTNLVYGEYVYGIDPLNIQNETFDIKEDVKLPVYGVQQDTSTMLVTIDEGDSLAKINAVTSGVYHSYNYCFASFGLRNIESVKLQGQADAMPVIEADVYSAYLTQTYHVLPQTDEYDGYSGMAKYYREMIFDDATLAKADNAEGDIKLYLDILCGVARESSLMGFKYDETYAMTTFSEAKSMVNKFYDESVTKIVLNLQGWMNDGYYHDVVDDIDIIRKLGGKKGLEELTKFVESKGGLLYADMAIQQVTFTADGYNYTAESSRYYGQGRSVSFGKMSPITYTNDVGLGYRENLYNLVSPKFLVRYVEGMNEEMKAYTVSGVSLRDLGNVLYSDKKRKELISRVDAQLIVKAMLAETASANQNVMLNNAFAYEFPYADDIINVSFYKNAYAIVNEEVPFYEMILHGIVDYSGKSYNLNANLTKAEECLQMIENGASPHFTFTKQNSSELKYTALNNYFSTTFDVWYKDSLNMYQRVNEVLKQVSNSTMEKHEILANGSKMTYSNGTVITVDYDTMKVTVEKNGSSSTYDFSNIE